MADLSKVIAGLEQCHYGKCTKCPYEFSSDMSCNDALLVDALEAIKDLQEKLKTAKDGRLELGRRLRDGNN